MREKQLNDSNNSRRFSVLPFMIFSSSFNIAPRAYVTILNKNASEALPLSSLESDSFLQEKKAGEIIQYSIKLVDPILTWTNHNKIV